MYPEDENAYKKRKINDIDILVPLDEIDQSLEVLGQMGYYVSSTKEKVSAEIIEKYLCDGVMTAIELYISERG